MGWLTPEEQQEVLKKYRIQAWYDCNGCGHPIPIQELPVINPKKGYHSWKRNRAPTQACRTLTAREPRSTYHSGSCLFCQTRCNDVRVGKLPKNYKENIKGDNEMAKKKAKKSKKSSKKGKSSGEVSSGVKSAMKAIVAAVNKKPKKGYWTKKKLAEKLGEKYGKKEVRSAIRQLRSGKKQLDKVKDYYMPMEEKESKKSKKDSSDSSDASDDASE